MSTEPPDSQVRTDDVRTAAHGRPELRFRCERAIWVLRDESGGLWLAPGVPAPPGEPGGVMPDITPNGRYAEGTRPRTLTGEDGGPPGSTLRTFLLVPATETWSARFVPVYALDEALLPSALSGSSGASTSAGER